jgi:hypothetical protein
VPFCAGGPGVVVFEGIRDLLVLLVAQDLIASIKENVVFLFDVFRQQIDVASGKPEELYLVVAVRDPPSITLCF